MKPLILCLFIFFSIKTLAYPIDPRPLRKLVAESQYIIVGYVKEIAQDTIRDNAEVWTNTKAIIEIKEVLQGNIKKKIIEVPFFPELICPQPENYQVNTLVLAFLDKKQGTYSTHALSYGEKSFKLDDLQSIQVYKDRIKEIQLIQKIGDEHKKFELTVDWLVKCAENPVTRWEGIYELSPTSDFMSYYKTSKSENFGLDLDKSQKERLKKALFERDKKANARYVDFGLVDLIYNEYTDEIDKMLLSHLKNISNEDIFFAIDYMRRLSHRTNNTRTQKIQQEFRNWYFQFDYTEIKKEKIEPLRSLIDEFIQIVE